MIIRINSILWFATTLLLTITGFYLIFYFKFPFNLLSKKVKYNNKVDTFSKIKLLNLSLASKIGVGSISGIAYAIVTGGIGTIFWIWISTIIMSFYTFMEVKAGVKYKEKVEKDIIGGPQVYIKKELKSPKLSIIYCVLIIITYLFSFILIQSNTIIKSLSYAFKMKEVYISIILSIITIFSIKKGINQISKIVSFIVPIMGISYIIIGLYIIIFNWNKVPQLLLNIIKEGTKIKSLIPLPLIIGFQRAIFSNEAGMGTTSMICALSNNDDYIEKAKVQIIGTYFISLVICTLSAIIVLTTNIDITKINNINSIEIMNYSFEYHFKNIGIYLLNTIISLFAFSTIITSYYYGYINLKYLYKNISNTIVLIIVIIVIVISKQLKTGLIWSIVDITTALATLINIYALFKIRNKIKEE